MKHQQEHPEEASLSAETVHLLRNHLGIILGFVDLALEDTPEADPRRSDLLEIKRAVGDAMALVRPSRR